MTALIATVIVLGVLIFVHELGHFWAAKAVGIEVQRFSIGLGPRIWGVQRGETEYVLSLIPLGGYVKMAGMADEVMEGVEGGGDPDHAVDPDRAFDTKPIWARTLVISAGVIMNFLFAFLLYTVVAGGWGVSELDSTRIEAVRAADLPAGAEALGGIPAGARIVALGNTPVAHWGEVREGFEEALPGRMIVRTAEPAGEYEVTIPDMPSDRAAIPAAFAVRVDPVVGAVLPGGAAEAGGIQGGDRIVALDGEPVVSWNAFVETVRSRAGTRVEVGLERRGESITRIVVPEGREEVDPASGLTSTIGVVGLSPVTPVVSVRVGIGEAIRTGVRETVAVTGFITTSLKDLVTGKVSARNLGSIVTIGQASGQAADAGLEIFLRFMALFSVNLAVLNLLPIPILDGGHLVFLLVEAVRGRPLSIEQRIRWSQLGLFIILGIMLLALSNDFLRLFGR